MRRRIDADIFNKDRTSRRDGRGDDKEGGRRKIARDLDVAKFAGTERSSTVARSNEISAPRKRSSRSVWSRDPLSRTSTPHAPKTPASKSAVLICADAETRMKRRVCGALVPLTVAGSVPCDGLDLRAERAQLRGDRLHRAAAERLVSFQPRAQTRACANAHQHPCGRTGIHTVDAARGSYSEPPQTRTLFPLRSISTPATRAMSALHRSPVPDLYCVLCALPRYSLVALARGGKWIYRQARPSARAKHRVRRKAGSFSYEYFGPITLYTAVMADPLLANEDSVQGGIFVNERVSAAGSG